MNDFDLDHLGDVWRQQPDPAELESLKRAAEAVSRRARWGSLIEIASALFVGGAVVFLVLLNPARDTLMAGAVAIIILALGQIRQRRLRQEELRSLTGSAEEMLDQSLRRVEATLRRTRFSLAALPPGLIIGFGFSYVADKRAAGDFLERIFRFGSEPLTTTVIKLAVVTALVTMTIAMWRAMRREKGELERLTALRDAYRAERELSVEDQPSEA